jgi:hypothetical protein
MDWHGTVQVSEEDRARFAEIQEGEGLALLSVTFDGEPTSAIVSISQVEEGGDYFLAPLAILVTPAMVERIRDPEGRTPQEGADGG